MEGSIPFGPKAVNVKIVLDMHRSMPLSMQLAAALKNDIVRGIWKPGDVLPTIRELAQTCAKTSTKTARRALEILAAEGWTMPKRGVGSVVVERGMDVREQGRILICGYGMGYSYYPMKFMFLLGQRLRTQGYGMHSIVGKRSDRVELRRLAAVLKERWSLVLIMGSGAEERKLVAESGRPFALVGNGAPLPRFSAPSCIGRFEIRCGKAIPEFIRECVRRRIARVIQFKYMEGAFDVAWYLAQAGVVVETVNIPSKSSLEGVVRTSFATMCQVVAKRNLPGLFLFTDDYVAQGALLALALAGIRIPEDVAVVTHANKGLGPVWAKPLSRMEMDPSAHARAVASAVIGYLKSGEPPPDLDLGSVWKRGKTF